MGVDAGRIEIPQGWGEVPLAGKAEPFDLSKPLTEAADIQNKQADTQDTEATTALRQAQLPGEQAKSTLAQMDTNAAQIAQAMQGYDPTNPGATDTALQHLADSGNAEAAQYIGKLDMATAQRLSQSLNDNQVRRSSNVNDLAAGTPDVGDGPHSGDELRQQFSNLPPAQLAQVAQHLQTVHAALERVYHSPDPVKQWSVEMKALPPELQAQFGNASFDVLSLNSHFAETEQALPIVQSIMDQRGMGLPGAPPDTDYKEVGGNLYAISPNAPAGQQVTPVTNNRTLVGTDSNGRGIYEGPAGEEVGTHVLGAKPGTDHSTAFDAKQQAWLAVHPGDAAGALQYAGGRGQGTLSPVQIQQAAASQAARDLQALNLSSSPPADPAAYLATQTQAHVAELTAAAATPADTGAPAGPAASRPNDPNWNPPPPPQDGRTPARQQYGTALSSLQHSLAGMQPGSPTYNQTLQRLQKVQGDAARDVPPMANPGVQPPARAIAQLKQAGDGVPVAFPNGTTWMMKGGHPVRLW